jgi:hypothetical protein
VVFGKTMPVHVLQAECLQCSGEVVRACLPQHLMLWEYREVNVLAQLLTLNMCNDEFCKLIINHHHTENCKQGHAGFNLITITCLMACMLIAVTTTLWAPKRTIAAHTHLALALCLQHGQ